MAANPKILRRRLPELRSFWVRYRPREWPGPETGWLDPIDRRLVPGADATVAIRSTPAIDAACDKLETIDDVLYVPPVAARHSAARDRLVARGQELGVPLVVQVGWSAAKPCDESILESSNEPLGSSILQVVDPLPLLLDQRFEGLDRLPAGSHLVLPLLPGLTSEVAVWRRLCARLAKSQAAAVYPVVAKLDAADRRRLAERLPSETVYRELFHGQPRDPREFAQTAASFGLLSIPSRPIPKAPARLRRRRWAAGQLATIAELWLALGRPPVPGQDFFRAARRLDAEDLDLEGLWRDGNLEVLDWLQGRVGRVLEELLADQRSELREELEREYLRL